MKHTKSILLAALLCASAAILVSQELINVETNPLAQQISLLLTNIGNALKIIQEGPPKTDDGKPRIPSAPLTLDIVSMQKIAALFQYLGIMFVEPTLDVVIGKMNFIIEDLPSLIVGMPMLKANRLNPPIIIGLTRQIDEKTTTLEKLRTIVSVLRPSLAEPKKAIHLLETILMRVDLPDHITVTVAGFIGLMHAILDSNDKLDQDGVIAVQNILNTVLDFLEKLYNNSDKLGDLYLENDRLAFLRSLYINKAAVITLIERHANQIQDVITKAKSIRNTDLRALDINVEKALKNLGLVS